MTFALRATTATGVAESTSTRTRRRRRAAPTATAATATPMELTWANRRPGSPGFERWAAYVGHRIDEDGLAAAGPAIDSLVALATRLGVAPVAVGVLADAGEPEPARLRAFAAVVGALLATR